MIFIIKKHILKFLNKDVLYIILNYLNFQHPISNIYKESLFYNLKKNIDIQPNQLLKITNKSHKFYTIYIYYKNKLINYYIKHY